MLNALLNAQPQPEYSVVLNGKDITRNLDNRLISLRITDNRSSNWTTATACWRFRQRAKS